MIDRSRYNVKLDSVLILMFIVSMILGYFLSSNVLVFDDAKNYLRITISANTDRTLQVEWNVSAVSEEIYEIKREPGEEFLDMKVECYPSDCSIQESGSLKVYNASGYILLRAKVNMSVHNLTLPVYPIYQLNNPQGSKLIYVEYDDVNVSLTNYNKKNICLDRLDHSILLLDPEFYYLSLNTEQCDRDVLYLFNPMIFELIKYMMLSLLLFHIIYSAYLIMMVNNIPPRSIPPSLTPEQIASVIGSIGYLVFREIENAARDSQKRLDEYINNLIYVRSDPYPKSNSIYPGPNDDPTIYMIHTYGSPIIDFIEKVRDKIDRNEYISPEMEERSKQLINIFYPVIRNQRTILVLSIIPLIALITGYRIDNNIFILIIILIGLMSLYMAYSSIKHNDFDILPLAIYLMYVFYEFNVLNRTVDYGDSWIISSIIYSIPLLFLIQILNLILVLIFRISDLNIGFFRNTLNLEVLGYMKYLNNIATRINNRQELDYAIVLGIPEHKIQQMISHDQELQNVLKLYNMIQNEYTRYTSSRRRTRGKIRWKSR